MLENLCGSLKSLKSLCFHDVTITGTELFVPRPGLLESLVLDLHEESAELATAWLDGNYKSFSSLRTLHARRLSSETLANILDKCRSLVEFRYLDPCSPNDGNSMDEHLQALSRPSSVSLKSLSLMEGCFTSLALSAFIEAFPPSITQLSLSRSEGSNFRLLLKLPSLQYLECDMFVAKDDELELEHIAKNELPPGLQVEWSLFE